MQVMILAGGYGSRIADVNDQIPKPMILIDNRPIIEHIVNIYRNYGLKKFIILGGYKHNKIYNFFKRNNNKFSDCEIKVLNTGIHTLTGSRVLKAKKFIKEKNFLVTYGDGVSDININKLINFHKKNAKVATITAVRPPARFGELVLKNNLVEKFDEKIQLNKSWINGGFFVFKKEFFNFISKKNTMLETFPMQKLLQSKNLSCYRHKGYWQCIDNRRDLNSVRLILKKKSAPWIKN